MDSLNVSHPVCVLVCFAAEMLARLDNGVLCQPPPPRSVLCTLLCFSNVPVHEDYLVKVTILVQNIWGGAWDAALPTHF